MYSGDSRTLKTLFDLASRASKSKSTLPILTYTLLDTTSGKLVIRSTDLMRTVQVSSNTIMPTSSAAIALPTEIFRGALDNWTGELNIVYNASDKSISLTNKKSKMKVKGVSADDFPPFGISEVKKSGKLPWINFKQAVERVAICAIKNDANPLLEGIHISIEENRTAFIESASGKALAVDSSMMIDGDSGWDITVIASDLTSFISFPLTAGFVRLDWYLSSLNFVVEADDGYELQYSCQSITGQYPNIRQLIVGDPANIFPVDSAELYPAMKRIYLFSRDQEVSPAVALYKDNLLKIGYITGESGDAIEEVECPGSSGEYKFAINLNDFLKFLKISNGDVKIGQNTPVTPILLTCDNIKDYKMAVTPMFLESVAYCDPFLK